MVGESEITELVGDVNSDVSVDGTRVEELSMVLALVGDSQCLPLLWRRMGRPAPIVAS